MPLGKYFDEVCAHGYRIPAEDCKQCEENSWVREEERHEHFASLNKRPSTGFKPGEL